MGQRCMVYFQRANIQVTAVALTRCGGGDKNIKKKTKLFGFIWKNKLSFFSWKNWWTVTNLRYISKSNIKTYLDFALALCSHYKGPRFLMVLAKIFQIIKQMVIKNRRPYTVFLSSKPWFFFTCSLPPFFSLHLIFFPWERPRIILYLTILSREVLRSMLTRELH